MTIREDFVTNSSSNNFIFAFKDRADWDEFKNYCECYEYENVITMLYNKLSEVDKDRCYDKNAVICAGNESQDNLKALKDTAYRFISQEERHKLLDEVFADENFTTPTNKYVEMSRIENTSGFQKQLLERVLESTDWREIETRLNSSEIVVSGMIWDTDGGIFEWACRNGFLLEVFGQWCVISYNVG